MGYLEIPSSALADFSKAVISFWFRIPTETFTAMSAISNSLPPGFQRDHMASACYTPSLFKIIPLIVFGSVENDDFANPIQPSFIGVDTYFGQNTLACNLQTPVSGLVSGDSAAGPSRPGCFYMAGYSVLGVATPSDTLIAPDVWHHALISFDISGSESATYYTITGSEPPPSFGGTSTFSWALDDVSKVGPSMSSSGGGSITGLADNIIVTDWIVDASADLSTNDLLVSFSGGYIASSGNPIGIPMSAAFVSNGQKVELAELQIFTGVTTDASVEGNRRAFIGADGSPADMALAETLLGQAPAIKLHLSSSWTTGTNTGSLGTNFTPTGTITTYTTAPDITP